MIAIFKREFKAYFTTPVGFIVLAAFYFFLGYFFTVLYGAGVPDVAQIIMAMSTIIVFTVPVITMRLISEDRRQKVDQVLFTAPVRLSSVVFGKYLAALALFALGFAPTVVFEIIMATKVPVHLFSYLYAMVGMLLLGGTLIAIGMFISSLTESNVLSAILTLFVNIIVILMSGFTSGIKVTWIANVLKALSFMTAFESFGENIFSVTDVVYFVSLIAGFLFLSIRALDVKRWS